LSKSFTALGVSEAVVRTLAGLGIHTPFAIQRLVLEDALAGRDVLAAAPTGSGKTLAFGLPIVERVASRRRGPAALVLVPTRELASQIVTDLHPHVRARSLEIAAVYGGMPVSPQARRARNADIVVATPGRLFDLIERRLIRLDGVRIVVLDEADRMLDMGFRPQVDRVFAGLAARRQTMLFSATLDRAVLDLASSYTRDAVTHTATAVVGEAEHGEVRHEFVRVTHDGKLDALVSQLGRDRGLALVFVRTKHGADKLVRKLARRYKVAAGAMHGNMSQNARERALSAFASGRISTLVATDVAARGLDLDDITHVINFDPPHSHTDYVHRIGRTGRAGRTGTGITFVLPDQADDVRRLAVRLGHRGAFAASGLR
jgi:ATP-dependent RNA helicase RhlE